MALKAINHMQISKIMLDFRIISSGPFSPSIVQQRPQNSCCLLMPPCGEQPHLFQAVSHSQSHTHTEILAAFILDNVFLRQKGDQDDLFVLA